MKKYLTTVIAIIALVIAIRASKGENTHGWIVTYWIFNTVICFGNAVAERRRGKGEGKE